MVLVVLFAPVHRRARSIVPQPYGAAGCESIVGAGDTAVRADHRYNPVIMSVAPTPAQAVEDFIARWQGVTASELATAQSFVIDLCRLLDLPKPHATPEQDYMFERPVSFRHGDGSSSPGRIDCYRRDAFVLEAKKTRRWRHGESLRRRPAARPQPGRELRPRPARRRKAGRPS